MTKNNIRTYVLYLDTKKGVITKFLELHHNTINIYFTQHPINIINITTESILTKHPEHPVPEYI